MGGVPVPDFDVVGKIVHPILDGMEHAVVDPIEGVLNEMINEIDNAFNIVEGKIDFGFTYLINILNNFFEGVGYGFMCVGLFIKNFFGGSISCTFVVFGLIFIYSWKGLLWCLFSIIGKMINGPNYFDMVWGYIDDFVSLTGDSIEGYLMDAFTADCFPCSQERFKNYFKL